MLPAASLIVAVRILVAPDARSAVEPVSWIWVAAPGTTSNAPRVPVVSPAAVASIVTEPARAPVIVLVATPSAAVALPVPLTVPAPEACANAITVELSEVTVLPAASSIVAVRTRVAPEARSAVEPVSTMSAAAPWTTSKEARVPVVSPAAVASIVTGPARTPVIVFVATPARRGRVATPADGADPGLLGEGDHRRVVGGDRVAGCVADRRGQHPRRAGGEVCGRAGQDDARSRAVNDGEGAEIAAREPGRGRLHRDGTGELSGDRLRRDAAGRGGVAGAADGTGAALLRECDDGRVVGGDGVAGGVLDRRRQHTGGAGGEVRGRPGERDLGRSARHDVERAEGAGGEAGGGGFHRDRCRRGRR